MQRGEEKEEAHEEVRVGAIGNGRGRIEQASCKRAWVGRIIRSMPMRRGWEKENGRAGPGRSEKMPGEKKPK